MDRAVDSSGAMIDFLLSAKRDAAAANHPRHGFPPLFATGFVEDTDPVFSVFHPAEGLNMIPVFRSSLFSDSQIPWH
jgi:hypothetical protein